MATATSPAADRIRDRLARILPSPRVTPLAIAMLVVLPGVAVTLRLMGGPRLLDDAVAWASTNVENLASHPVAALTASAFIVPSGLLPELLLVGVGFVALERGIGTARTAAVAFGGHVGATLLTVYGAELFTDPAANRSDVGVSYAMFAVLAAAAGRLSGRSRIAASTVLGAAVGIPFVSAPGVTTTGHVLAATLGPVILALLPQRRAQPGPADGTRVAGLGGMLTRWRQGAPALGRGAQESA
ncbi:hypothetical protein GCM10010172_03700 [Paractinoplanes ferrugineus]|uniref:Uncharacterized protein n=1 Tax=Paractinoplanes ferrugineus TaxID=113564 RepID=A0A919J4J1_9ACTN|nr:rhomboid-like protein [Actinoplanes ferrugineus]GIE13775.1 hypothetical protein Afe05nite_56150 [Actinoplanes ferrugineus]